MKKIYIVLIIIFIVFSIIFLYNRFAFINIIVKFDELEPFEKQMNVYYKGFKVGRTTKIYPDKDYINTYLKLKLKASKVNFPSNITVRINKKKSNGYVSILYPDDPSLIKLKNNDQVKGIITKDINSLLDEKFSGDDIDVIVDDATNLIESANTAVQNLSDIFVEIKDLIADCSPDIKIAAKNLSNTTTNLEKISDNLSVSLDSNTVSSSVGNIKDTTENIKEITSNLSEITNQIDKTTLPIVNSVLCQTQMTIKNVDEITDGIKNTLKKRMGLSRMLFGKPLSNDNNSD